MNVSKLVGAIFTITGSAFLAVSGVLLSNNLSFVDRAHSSSGEVVELVRSRSDSGSTYASRISFVDRNGEAVEFVESMSSNPPRHHRGETVRVLYDPYAPSRAIIDDFWGRYGVAIILGPLGLVFAGVGIALVASGYWRRRRQRRLMQTGRAIEAEFLHVFVDDRFEDNGRRPFRIAAQAVDPRTGTLRRFDSAPIWVDPTRELSGRTLRVLIDPKDADRYLVDLNGVVDPREIA